MSYELMPLGMAALALLAERPMHPYEMYQVLLLRKEDRIVKVRPGSLYHAVNKLDEAGLVRVTGTDRDGNRPERTTYEITDEGREQLLDRVEELIAEPINEYPRFPLAIGQAHNLPLSKVIQLLRTRLAALAVDREQGMTEYEEVQAKGVPARYLLDAPYLFAMHDAEVAYLEKLIADLESGVIDWEAEKPVGLQHTIKD
ncbi:PadR family transcriptional regulator [Glaciihabitans arcticus]|uniref:PadR family transcriptional regulator n=1 Tax=Glaciihabitans arcticus TaxID=2668039 RepID=A0A4Q9GSQ2_9MICO|nr:PadR family transcriptional regulator [Glaciihabitans arcticus]TBN58042.1 PadR family transcriptional regulator [Glaciihabitans arcticus]